MLRLAAAALAVFLAAAPAFAAASADADASAARQAMRRGDWQQAVAQWQLLYAKGDREAPAQLCTIYFDARQGRFEPARAVDWCRRAAGNGDAWARYRMGLLYFVGLGVERDIGQAQALCAAAAAEGAAGVPAGFCLAAADSERQRAAAAELQPPPLRGAVAAQPAAPRHHPADCAGAFAAPMFDAAAATAACAKEAAAGDAEALHRLGLMRLLGVGGERNLDAAATDCAGAAAIGGSDAPAAFCLAAVAQLRRDTARLAMSRRTGSVDVDPTIGRPLPKTEDDPYALDRALDAPHATATGLAYTCRQISDWAQYEAPGLAILNPRDSLFGRRILDLRPADFAALDAAAASCVQSVGHFDPRGALAPNFTAFRRAIGPLKARQAELRAEQRDSRQEAARIAEVDRAYGSGRVMAPLAGVSAQESACFDRVRAAWRASGAGSGRRSLEIRDSRLATEGGRFVASGTANVVESDTVRRDTIASSVFTCTFEQGTSNRVASFQLLPGFAAARQLTGVR